MMGNALRMYTVNTKEKPRKLAIKVAVNLALQGHHVVLWSNEFSLDKIESFVSEYAANLHHELIDGKGGGTLRLKKETKTMLDFDAVEAADSTDLFIQI